MKKKILIVLGILIIIIVVFGIVFLIVNNIRAEKTGLYNKKYESSLDETNEENQVFYGTIIDTLGIYEQVNWVIVPPAPIQITIEPEPNEQIRKSSNKIITYVNDSNGNSYEPGTKVKVTYTGDIKETNPVQVDSISIEEIENKTLNMYKKILEDLIKQDSALNTDAKFIAIDFGNFLAHHKDRYSKDNQYRSLSPNEKQALLDFCKQYNENVIEANFEQLKEKGYFNEETKRLDGILISVSKTESINEEKAILRISKYRSALGAIMPKYELNLINGYDWNLKVVDTMIS